MYNSPVVTLITISFIVIVIIHVKWQVCCVCCMCMLIPDISATLQCIDVPYMMSLWVCAVQMCMWLNVCHSVVMVCPSLCVVCCVCVFLCWINLLCLCSQQAFCFSSLFPPLVYLSHSPSLLFPLYLFLCSCLCIYIFVAVCVLSIVLSLSACIRSCCRFDPSLLQDINKEDSVWQLSLFVWGKSARVWQCVCVDVSWFDIFSVVYHISFQLVLVCV